MDFEKETQNNNEFEINEEVTEIEASDVDSSEESTEIEEFDTQADAEPQTRGNKIVKEIMDWVISIALAIIIALVIRTYVFTLVRVDGQSMNSTLAHGDTLYAHKLFYQPDNGDIIIFHPQTAPEKAYIKRVIATEGQTVYIDPASYKVYVDGELLDEPYIDGKPTHPKDFGEKNGTTFVVPEDHVFVLGDNRTNSADSRYHSVGYVSLDSIEGRAIFRLLPFSSFGLVD